MDDFCREKCIRGEYSVAKTPQQNGVAERRNRTLVKAARKMLADFKLPTTFWAEAVFTACYDQNRVLIVKPHKKTPYELFRGIKPALSFIRPFGCHVTILNTLDHLGKFDGKGDEENKPMIEGNGPKWLFDIDSLTQSMNYVPVTAGTTTNESAYSQGDLNAGTFTWNDATSQDCIVMPIWKDTSYFDLSSKDNDNEAPQPPRDLGKKVDEGVSNACGIDDEDRPESSTPNINTARTSINTARPSINTTGLSVNTVGPSVNTVAPRVNTTSANFNHGSTSANSSGDQTKLDVSNLNISYQVSTTPHTIINKDHSLEQVIGDLQAGVQTRGMTQAANEQGLLSDAYKKKSHKDLNTCLFFCFLSQEEPKRVSKALSDSSLVEAMQEELLQFKLQKVWVLVDLPKGKGPLGHTQEEGIDYDEIDEEVYVCQPLGFEDPDYPDKVYKVEKAMYGLHQAPRAWKVNYTDVKTASTIIDLERLLVLDKDVDDIDVHLSRSMIGSLMYLIASRPDIMFAVGDEAVHKELGDRMEKTATTDSCLEVEQDSEFYDKHNMMAYLEKYEGSEGFEQIIDFLSASHIKYALTKNPTIYTSHIKQFWRTAALCTVNDGVHRLSATIDKKVKLLVTEASLRRHLKLEDSEGLTSLTNAEIFEQLAHMGYVTNSDALTFLKAIFLRSGSFSYIPYSTI
ncbi:putative ribonuclease H-like domain-containing protein [Tanacetum coccineum]